MIRVELANNPIIRELRGAYAEKTIAQALKSMGDWEAVGNVRRLDQRARWYARVGEDNKKEFVVMRQRDDLDVDDLLG